jgi:GTPase SAR1 family protein
LTIQSSESLLTLQQSYQQALSPHFFWSRFFYGPPLLSLPRKLIRIGILGDRGVGKQSFIWRVTGLTPPGSISLTSSMMTVESSLSIERGAGDYAKPIDSVLFGGCMQSLQTHSNHNNNNNNHNSNNISNNNNTINNSYNHLIATAVTSFSHYATTTLSTLTTTTPTTPTTNTSNTSSTTQHIASEYFLAMMALPLDEFQRDATQYLQVCDLIILMFQCGNQDSLNTVYLVEEQLPQDLPRIYIGSKSDLVVSSTSTTMTTTNAVPITTTSPTNLPTTPSIKSVSQSKTTSPAALPSLPLPQPQEVINVEEHERILQQLQHHLQEQHVSTSILLTSTIETSTLPDTLQRLQEIIIHPQLAIPNIQEESSSSQASLSSSTSTSTSSSATTHLATTFTSPPSVAILSATLGIASLAVAFVYYKQEVREWMDFMVKTSKSWLFPN